VRTEALQRRRLLRERDDLGPRPLGRARQSDICAVDAELIHEVQQPLLDLGRRVAHARALQPVAQGLVVELDGAVVGLRRAAAAVSMSVSASYAEAASVLG